MTREECEAGVQLCDALADLPALKAAMKVEAECGIREVDISVGDRSDGGRSNITGIAVDVETGRLILVEAERIISERMAALGVIA